MSKEDTPEIFDEPALRDLAHEELIRKAANGSSTAIQILEKYDAAKEFEAIKKEIFEL